jgi:hypothetical protein
LATIFPETKEGGRVGGIRWSDLTFTPDAEAVSVLRSSWRWLLGDDWTPLLFSVWGDVFIARSNEVQWLNTGIGEVTTVAADEDAFRQALGDERTNDWFLPGLVAALNDAGKRPADGECFTYAIYPVFAEGKYEVWNFAPVPAKEHFGVSGDLHRQIADLPDGATVRLSVES